MFSNWLTSTTAASSMLPTNAPPPDVILEIGPLPFTRFAAHSTILVAHSGYMRSVLRPEERISECPVYVPNITAEHFAPLLTYMYTGFLDLNIENIFGVLLATHVLHMPRALEICRNFLARIQSDEYTNGSLFSKIPSRSAESVKIIRPIASKAPNSGLAFIAPPIAKTLFQSHDTPFKSLNENKSETHESANEMSDKIDVEKECDSPTASTSQIVNVDRISSDEAVVEERLIAKKPVRFRKRSHSRIKTSDNANKERTIELSTETQNISDADKIIIDIASCDGPVRFQRVLNSAYGRYPVKTEHEPRQTAQSEQNRANVANSFHMQMARNISERQSIETGRTDSENSEEIIVHDQKDKYMSSQRLKYKNCLEVVGGGGVGAAPKSDGEVYNCVYCKHTFKSQYCYQKHAKRHINPLSIDGGGSGVDSDRDDKSENSSSTAPHVLTTTTSSSPTQSIHSLSIKREVRPLDMNVQYYPCKTCGSKFPSYYFVHKHRKLCHANEEN